jgi:hypothetical protein
MNPLVNQRLLGVRIAIIMLAGLAWSAQVLASERCESALLGQSKKSGAIRASKAKQTVNGIKIKSSATSDLEAIINELVELALSGHVQAAGASPWQPINVQSLLGDKKAEIERTLGQKVAFQIFSEVKTRIIKHITEWDLSSAERHQAKAEGVNKHAKAKVIRAAFIRDLVDRRLVDSANFSHDGSKVLIAPQSRSAKLWDVQTGQLVRSFEGHTDELRSAVFSPDESQVLTASMDWMAIS